MIGEDRVKEPEPLITGQNLREQSLQEGPHIHLGGDATVHQVLQQLLVMMSQNILHHAQDIQRWVGKVLEPMLTPIYWTHKQNATL